MKFQPNNTIVEALIECVNARPDLALALLAAIGHATEWALKGFNPSVSPPQHSADHVRPPLVSFDIETFAVHVNEVSVGLSGAEFGLMCFLVEHCNRPNESFQKQSEAINPLGAFLTQFGQSLSPTSQKEQIAQWAKELTAPATAGDQRRESIQRRLNKLREKFRQKGLADFMDFLLPKRGAFVINVRCRKRTTWKSPR